MAASVAPHILVEELGCGRGGRRLFEGLSLNVPRGRFIAILGPSGIGKSSLLACLLGLLTPCRGRITLRCRLDCEHSPTTYRHRTGMVFQDWRLTATATVERNVLCGALGRLPWWRTLAGFPAEEYARVAPLLQRLGLAHLRHAPVAEISGGEQQRVALARALMQDPELILADEPVSNLDGRLADDVLGLLRQEVAVAQRTVVCVLHDRARAERAADGLLTLDPARPDGWRWEAR